MKRFNSYEDARRAEAYAKLAFSGTYYLAYRDLPEIIYGHVNGKNAMDFGCGTGRSTRFLKNIGFDVVGVDISVDMINKAREMDPGGDYCLVEDDNLSQLRKKTFDLILCAFTFDNIPTSGKKVSLFKDMGELLKGDGRIVNLVSSPDIYLHEWASFSTKDFPENKKARCGDIVKIIITDIEDKRPVEDIVWPDKAYRNVFERAGLDVVKMVKPLASERESYHWVNEIKIAPWVIYVLKKAYL